MPRWVDWIRQERWINYTRAEQVLVRLGELLRYPPRHRMPALLLFGATGMGKTRIIDCLGKSTVLVTHLDVSCPRSSNTFPWAIGLLVLAQIGPALLTREWLNLAKAQERGEVKEYRNPKHGI
jgi:hypothetical protein